MADEVVMENDPSSMAAEKKTVGLKNKLQRLVKAIVDEEEVEDKEGNDTDKVEDKALRVLNSLKDLKLKNYSYDDSLAVPEVFKCPITRELMGDPVVLATGLTYDRPFIERWLCEGHITCPQTQQVLSHTGLTPNYLVRKLIYQWCIERGIEPPKVCQDNDVIVLRGDDKPDIKSLLEKLSMLEYDQNETAKEIRSLSRKSPFTREFFGKSTEAITKLLGPLTPGEADRNPDLQENIIETLLNVSIVDQNKKLVGENTLAITLLVESMQCGTIRTKGNAAAALSTLADYDSNKIIIGNSGAIKPLINLLEEEDQCVVKDAACALFNICTCHEIKQKAIKEGAVPVLVKRIQEDVMVEPLFSILALLSAHQLAVDEMNKVNVMPLLLSIIRQNTCEKTKENSISIIQILLNNDRRKMRAINVEEANHGTITKLSQTGTSRARRKAAGILERLKKGAFITHTA
ncbi:U-box domain-containing protein 9 [Cannabis sativa]|uniref:U-box domain-containing protein 9 n=1 Tax=Cannabis sativa TaxID=3483 RepID=UPI0029C9B2F3|nr:U-box domain-containing protein 9 [Cannabis sativa]